MPYLMLTLVILTSCIDDSPRLDYKEQTLDSPTLFYMPPKNGYENCANEMGYNQFNKKYADKTCKEICETDKKRNCSKTI